MKVFHNYGRKMSEVYLGKENAFHIVEIKRRWDWLDWTVLSTQKFISTSECANSFSTDQCDVILITPL